LHESLIGVANWAETCGDIAVTAGADESDLLAWERIGKRPKYFAEVEAPARWMRNRDEKAKRR
jgi:hypothetical protein